VRLTVNIGYPKLFMGGAAGRREVPAVPTVNNFAAATGAATELGWPLMVISCIRLNVFPPRRARSANVKSHQRLSPRKLSGMSLLTGPSGGAWPFNDYSRGRLYCNDDSSILPSPGQACGRTK
jgi:hypothetical protein